MADDRLRCTSPAPEGCNKRFEKTRSRMVYHAIWGLGDTSPTSRIVNNDITMPRLPFLSERSDKTGYRNLYIIGTIVMKANRINNSSPKSSDKKLASLSLKNLAVNT